MIYALIGLFFLLFLFLAIRGTQIIPHRQAWVVERLGKFNRILSSGPNWIIPFIEYVAYRHPLKEEAIDRIALIPDRRANRSLRDLLDLLAEMTKWPLSKEFGLKWQKPFVWKPVRRRSDLLENQTLLLLDWSSSKEILQACLSELWPAFPKQVYILSLFEEEEMGQ